MAGGPSNPAPARGAAIAAVLAALWFVGPQAVDWVGGWAQTWNLYHYVVGTRFFGELGYEDLYLATLAVDRRHEDAFHDITVVRDLHTYVKEPRATAQLGYDVDAHLSPERQEELDQVMRALRGVERRPPWSDMFRDRGYNGTPSYTVVAAQVARALPIEHPATRFLATLIDPVLVGLGLGALGWAFGLEVAAWVALVLAVFPGTQYRWLGGFLEYDWLAALMIATAAVRSKRPTVAGVALAWATASRLFPAALLVSLVLPDLRRGGDRTFAGRVVLGFVVALSLFVALGCLTPRGVDAWIEFVPRILHHSEQHVLGDQRIGWRHVLLWTTPEDLRPVRSEALSLPALALAAGGLVAWAWAAFRRSREEALQLGWLVVFLVTVSSRYYWAGAALVPTVGLPRGRWLAVGLASTAVAQGVARAAGADKHGAYLAIEAVILLVLACWAAWCVATPPVTTATDARS